MASSTAAPESVFRKNAAQPAASAQCARFGILVSGDTDERGIVAFGRESLAKFDAGYLTKMNVEHQAVE